ncbi:Maf family protein [Desertibaculum subflavum]|uniref:Maf family protein n=1 Tax=Desertibaculum subflavum TaxID=2268458 RepID=UPI000E66A9EF
MGARAPLVLASASPRRLELLRQIGLDPDAVVPAEIDETPKPRELPAKYVLRLAEAKAAAVARARPGAFVLAADTAVACGRRILPKAEDEATAARCLDLLSGRRHRVMTGIAVVTPAGLKRSRVVTSAVRFKLLGPAEKRAYLATGEWHGKAGGYAIQGHAARLIPWIEGSYSNVVGLPLAEAADLLAGLGFMPKEAER